MKQLAIRILLSLLSISLLVCGAACAESDSYIGLYTFLGYYAEGQFVVDPELSTWSVNLGENGTGYLYWGEENQGLISEWSIDERRLVIHAGISVIDGVIIEGVMLLDMDDGFILGWAGPNAEIDKLRLTTMDDFMREHAAKEAAEGEPDAVAGTYYPFAKIRDGHCVAMPEGLENGRFIINDDGSAQCAEGDQLREYGWSIEGEAITFTDKDSGEIRHTGVIAGGILTLDVIYTNPDGSSFTTQDILAKKNADTSAISTISIEEYNALMRGD